MWWVLSVGIVVTLWEAAAALNLINPIILPPPHEFIGEIRAEAQFLMPAVGVERTGAHFVASPPSPRACSGSSLASSSPSWRAS